ncbi:NADH-quinone oxidoreductase subunit NuoE [Microbaculum marinisediminis]|uniref:NADH-quinone oxidoreductase subunit NuoE n=1 Tax=Microbaculum marinisediminis TaxID=2931392 RepID=A0AAW5R280_9HYPH|nr:NADH-quinone oxidoreductase subunit NuoE [Microbaculum sp. A6E488]MCT8974396.1 NADH-quinone oxidoreductase subunit NuoE [Microbaculum sp. A6E488]
MSVRRLWHEQPASFAFTADNAAWAEKAIKRYPEGRQASAVIPLLWKVQEQEGWVSEPAIRCVAEMLDMPNIRVLEVATFYTMFQLQPVGKKAHVQVCGTTPCMLRGAGDLISICKKRIAGHAHELSADGDFSWEEVECLGACVNAPMVQVFKDTYEDLTPESFEALLDDFAAGRTPKPGPQVDRHYSAPQGGPTVLNGEAKPAKAPAAKATAAKAATEKAAPNKAAAEKTAKEPKKAPAKPAKAEPAALSDEHKPTGLEAPREGKADNLKKISGVGPKIEGLLHSLGIFHFDQIAALTPDQVAWVDGYLKFKGRIGREDWISQAKTLAEGGETEFSKRTGKRK